MKKSKKILLFLGGGLIFLVLCGLLFSEDEKVVISNYVGTNLQESINELETLGFEVNEIYEYSIGAKEDTIIKQEPSAGSEIENGTKINLYISKILKYPDFLNDSYTENDINSFCNKYSITCNISYQEGLDNPDGKILSQSITGGTAVNVNDKLDVKIAKYVDPTANIKKYTVTFNTSGGSRINSKTVYEGSKVSKPSDPSRNGFIFTGWTLDGKSYDFNQTVKRDITLVATWKEKNKYTVSFNTDGGSPISSQNVYEGSKISKPSDPSRNGFVFTGWTLDGKSYDFNKSVNSNFTLVATWRQKKSFTVTFNTNGGSNIDSQTILEGDKVSKPVDPSKDGFVFTGWTLNGNSYNFGNKVTSNIDLIATWRQKKSFTVTFDSNGGSYVADQTIIEGDRVSKPTDPTRSGYNFTGWTLNGNNYNFGNTVTSNINLVATWKEKSLSASFTNIGARIWNGYSSNSYYAICTIDSANVTKIDKAYDNTYSIKFTYKVTLDTCLSRTCTCSMGVKIYDENNTVVGTGSIHNFDLAVGESAIDNDSVYFTLTSKDYRITFING